MERNYIRIKDFLSINSNSLICQKNPVFKGEPMKTYFWQRVVNAQNITITNCTHFEQLKKDDQNKKNFLRNSWFGDIYFK